MFVKRAFLAIAVSLTAMGCSDSGSANPTSGSSGDVSFVKGDVVLGDKSATVEIIEYASTTCGHCRTFHKTILPRVKSDFIETGKAKLIYRDLPTPPAAVSAAGGAIARCAGEDKYYDVLDDVFTNQYDILMASQSGGALAELVKIGGRHGLDETAVRACVSNVDVLDEIAASEAKGTSQGVSSTPTIFVNGERVPSSKMSFEGISGLINAELGIEPATSDADAAPTEDAAH